MKTIIAIDPGTTESAFLKWDGEKLGAFDTVSNGTLLEGLREDESDSELCIEMIASYGMPVGKETFETCLWIGRFIEAWGRIQTTTLVYRKDVKIHHCGSMRAKDGNIRQALIDKYGEPGTKKAPGLTYGISKHLWSAFAIATFISETQQKGKP